MQRLLAILLVTASLAGCTQILEDVRENVTPRGPGSDYEAYLTGGDRLVVELDHAPGAEWDETTAVDEHVRDQLETITAKDVEIRTSRDLSAKGDGYTWSTEELRELHREHQDLASDEDEVVMHALFVDGRYEEDAALGLSFAAQAFAVFQGKIQQDTCANDALVCPNGQTRTWKANRAVTVHEAGHLFGLVDSPLPMVEDHKMDSDPDPSTSENEAGDSHSDNEDSVMHWSVNTGGAITNVFGEEGPPYAFDADDLQDARALRSAR